MFVHWAVSCRWGYYPCHCTIDIIQTAKGCSVINIRSQMAKFSYVIVYLINHTYLVPLYFSENCHAFRNVKQSCPLWIYSCLLNDNSIRSISWRANLLVVLIFSESYMPLFSLKMNILFQTFPSFIYSAWLYA